MASPSWMHISALSTEALQELADLKEFAFAEVDSGGVIRSLNPFARLCWDWEEGRSVPQDVGMVLQDMPEMGSETLPLKKGELFLHAVRLEGDQGWVIIGYEPETLDTQDEDELPFRTLLDRMPVVVMRMQTDGTIVSANQEASRISGYALDEIVGTRFWSRVVLPEHLSAVEGAIRSVVSHQPTALTFQYRTAQGPVRRAEMHLYFSDAYEVEAVVLDKTGAAEPGLDDLSKTLRAAIDQSPVGMLYVDGTGTVRYINNRIREMVGITTADSWMMRVLDEAPGFDPDAAGHVRRCIRDGDAGRGIEASFETASGMVQRASLSVSPVYNDGRRAGCTVMLSTVGGRDGWDDPKSRYDAAAATLREIATASPDETVFLDSAARIVGEAVGADRVRILFNDPAANQPFTRAIWTATAGFARRSYGGDREVLVTMGPAQELYIGPDDDAEAAALASVIDLHEAHWIRLNEGGGFEAFLALERLDGGHDTRKAWTPRERSFLKKLVEVFETLWSWIQVGSRYRMVVSSIADVPFGFAYGEDGSRRYLFMTDQIENLTGRTAQELTNLHDTSLDWIETVVHADDRAMVRAHDRTLEQGHDSRITYRVLHRDGSVRWVQEQAAPQPDNAGFSNVSGILTDITERREGEQLILDAKKGAELASSQKTGFIATLSHEIRTPLGAVNGYAELLDREIRDYEDRTGVGLPLEIKEFVRSIGDRSKRLLTLVQDLFEVSSLEMGKVVLQKRPVAIHTIIRRSAQKLAPNLREKGIRMRLQLDSRDPQVTADPHRLEQVLDHLISNAVKFTEQGSITVRTRAARRQVMVEVIDTGVGISSEFKDRLFDPFTQEDDWKNRRFEGTGLGLSVVKRLVELMNGSVEVESEKDDGSTFRILLPAALATEGSGPRQAKPHRG